MGSSWILEVQATTSFHIPGPPTPTTTTTTNKLCHLGSHLTSGSIFSHL